MRNCLSQNVTREKTQPMHNTKLSVKDENFL